MIVECKYLDSFGFERVTVLQDISVESFKKVFKKLNDDEIMKLKANPIMFGATGKYLQFIELDGNPLVYDACVNVTVELQLRDLTIVDIDLKNLFIDRNIKLASKHLYDEIYNKTGYVIDVNKIKPSKCLQVKELDISSKFKSARKI